LNYSEACEELKKASRLGSRPGLGNIRRLCALLGDPQDGLHTIHVAGTNGKGSVSAMTAAVLTAAGYKTGLFVSPHIESYNDGFLIRGQSVSKGDFAHAFSDVYEKSKLMEREEMNVTEFEMLAACAFVLFRQKGCDAAVIEAGMGGRLDATNVIRLPLISVITAISKDHTDYLGETVEEITRHKCGIIKKGGITVCYPDQPKGVVGIVKETAAEKKNMLYIPDASGLYVLSSTLEGTRFRYRGLDMRVSMPGRFQAQNAATAVETAIALREERGFHISGADIVKGLAEAHMPARQELLFKNPPVLLDGAHNVQGIEALADTVRHNLKGRGLAVVMGMLKDKPYEQCIAVMAGLADGFFAAAPDSPRALPAEAAADLARRYCRGARAFSDAEEALRAAADFAGRSGAIVICGSFYLAAAMRRAARNIFGKPENR